MIFLGSRYASETVESVVLNEGSSLVRSVFRRPPTTYSTANLDVYQWVDGDRIDRVSYRLLGDDSLWWMIMDVNPTILSPFRIKAGDFIWMPSRG